MRKVFIVKLAEAERALLQEVTTTGVAPARKVLHAQMLLKADQAEGAPAWPDARICAAFNVSRATVERVRKQYLVAGVDAALIRKRPPPGLRKLDGAAEAQLIATACSAPPAGHTRWTLRLLADRLVELEQVDSLSHETVRRILKKTSSSRG
jgi:transposase